MRKTFLIPALLLIATGLAAQDTQITGFVDAAYFLDAADGSGEFGLDQVEIDVIHQASDKTLVRADVEWVKNGEGYDAQVEQAFMVYSPRCGWDFTFGKFNAPIGFELLDAPDMYQYSHALVFDYASPTNLTGAMVNRELGGGFDLAAHVSNGWDRATADENHTWGGRLGYVKEGFAGGVSAISGKEIGDDGAAAKADFAFTRTVFDVDLSYSLDRWLFGADFNKGKVDLPGGLEAEWMGFLLMTHVDFNEWAGFTVRYDSFDDEDGWAFGPVGSEFQQRQAFTFAPTFVLDDGFGALVELRIDTSDQDAFLDGDGLPTDSSTAIAFEMTYGW